MSWLWVVLLRVKIRWIQVLIALDQLVNTFFPGGYADETLSARAWRHRDDQWWWVHKVIDKLFFWQENHCLGAWQDEMRRLQYPKAYRDVDNRKTA